jgi:hypothetical protein
MRWLPYLWTSVLTLGLTVSNAQANAGCSFTPMEVHGDGVSFEGTTTRLRAVSYTVPKIAGTDQVDLRKVKDDFVLIKRVGFNAVRSYEPLSPEVLQTAENLELLVVEALVHLSDDTNFDSDEELSDIIERTRRIVIRDRCKPNVVLWVLWNDAPFNWGLSGGNVVERFGSQTVHRFLRRLRDEVKKLDPLRPVTAANVLNANHSEIGMDLLDVIGVNAYLGVFDWPSQRYSHSLAQETITRVRHISEKYQKPIWVSETGISSIPGSDQAKRVIPMQLQLIDWAGFAGFAVFQWQDDHLKARNHAQPDRDIEANWGLLNIEGVPKPSLKAVSSVLQGSAIDLNQFEQTIRDPWITYDEGSSELYTSRSLEDFGAEIHNPVRVAYRIRSKGRSHAYLRVPQKPGQHPHGLSIRYVPEDYGAWLIFGRTLSKSIPIDKFENLVVDFDEYSGGLVNLSIIMRLTDGSIMRTPPLMLKSSKAQSYELKLSNFIGDARVTDDMAEVAEISFRLNDVANFEEVGIPVQIVFKGLRLTIKK